MLTDITHCPHCGSRAIIGVEIRGVYDGVGYWQCTSCSMATNRFSVESRYYARIQEAVDAVNNRTP